MRRAERSPGTQPRAIGISMVDRLFSGKYLDTLEARSTRGDGMLELVLFWLSG